MRNSRMRFQSVITCSILILVFGCGHKQSPQPDTVDKAFLNSANAEQAALAAGISQYTKLVVESRSKMGSDSVWRQKAVDTMKSVVATTDRIAKIAPPTAALSEVDKYQKRAAEIIKPASLFAIQALKESDQAKFVASAMELQVASALLGQAQQELAGYINARKLKGGPN
jgi:hypothetical protein